MPILYYRANRTGRWHDEAFVSRMAPTDNADNIYNFWDNQQLLQLGIPWQVGHPQHPLEDPRVFYEMTRDKRVTTMSVPHNPHSYILISAGPDGLYGTNDDVTNFGR